MKTLFQTFLIYTCRNTYSKGRTLVKMYRVVSQIKRGKYLLNNTYHCSWW